MNVSTRLVDYTTALLDTSLDAIAVKKKGFRIDGPLTDCGILVSPFVGRGPAAEAQLKQVMSSFHPEVIVRGHGWIAGEYFVWKGTSEEFNQTWVID